MIALHGFCGWKYPVCVLSEIVGEIGALAVLEWNTYSIAGHSEYIC